MDQTKYSAAPSAPPSNATASPLNSSSIEIIWEPPPLLDRNGPIDSYIVKITNDADGGNSSYNLSESDFVFHIEGI